MACVNDEQIRMLLAAPDDADHERVWAHVARCEACRKRVEAAGGVGEVIAHLRELRAARQDIDSLLDGVHKRVDALESAAPRDVR